MIIEECSPAQWPPLTGITVLNVKETHTNTGTHKKRDVKMSQCTHSSISFVYKVNRKSLIPKKKKTSYEVTVTVQ